MSLFTWLDQTISKFRWFDISLVKLSTAAFILLIAKCWPPLLSLDWHWYLAIAVVAAIRPFYVMFAK